MRICERCGDTFDGRADALFCSSSCRQKAYRQRRDPTAKPNAQRAAHLRRRSDRSPGRRLYDAVTGQYDLDEHELGLLREASHCADTMDDLQKQVDRDGTMLRKDLQGPPRPHPALAALRGERAIYLQLLKALHLPSGVDGETVRVVKGRDRDVAAVRDRATAFETGNKLRGVPGGLA
jgi:hypothetical protein